MHLNAQRPVFVPDHFQREMEKLSKAALMDMVWDYAFQITGGQHNLTIDEIRNRRDIILTHRRNAKVADATQPCKGQ
jgi:hypothetical protein